MYELTLSKLRRILETRDFVDGITVVGKPSLFEIGHLDKMFKIDDYSEVRVVRMSIGLLNDSTILLQTIENMFDEIDFISQVYLTDRCVDSLIRGKMSLSELVRGIPLTTAKLSRELGVNPSTLAGVIYGGGFSKTLLFSMLKRYPLLPYDRLVEV